MNEEKEKKEPVTWQQLLDEGTAQLEYAEIAESGLDAWYLLEAAFKIDRIHFLMDRNRTVFSDILEKNLPKYQEFLKKRAERIPLQQILGTQEFMGFSFYVNESVLIPRQDTETLVETVLKEQKNEKCSILDICTGSGCIAVSLALLGGYEQVTALDVSKDALKIAKKNISSLYQVQKGIVRSESKFISEQPLQWSSTVYLAADSEKKNAELLSFRDAEKAAFVRKKFTLLESDLLEQLDPKEKYDVIVSNPPYIPSEVVETLEPEVRDHEPRLALDGREDGLYFYRILSEQCRNYLNAGGSIYFEIGWDQAEAVSEFLRKAGYEKIETVKDAPGLDRVVKAVWNGNDTGNE